MMKEHAATWTQAGVNGVYWWRYDTSYEPEIVEVRDGQFYSIADLDPTSVSMGEFLGPVTPDLFVEVRNATERFGAERELLTEYQLRKEMDQAERKAWDSLARYKFMMFGYWAALWVHFNRVGKFRERNPFAAAVKLAREQTAQ